MTFSPAQFGQTVAASRSSIDRRIEKGLPQSWQRYSYIGMLALLGTIGPFSLQEYRPLVQIAFGPSQNPVQIAGRAFCAQKKDSGATNPSHTRIR